MPIANWNRVPIDDLLNRRAPGAGSGFHGPPTGGTARTGPLGSATPGFGYTPKPEAGIPSTPSALARYTSPGYLLRSVAPAVTSAVGRAAGGVGLALYPSEVGVGSDTPRSYGAVSGFREFTPEEQTAMAARQDKERVERDAGTLDKRVAPRPAPNIFGSSSSSATSGSAGISRSNTPGVSAPGGTPAKAETTAKPVATQTQTKQNEQKQTPKPDTTQTKQNEQKQTPKPATTLTATVTRSPSGELTGTLPNGSGGTGSFGIKPGNAVDRTSSHVWVDGAQPGHRANIANPLLGTTGVPGGADAGMKRIEEGLQGRHAGGLTILENDQTASTERKMLAHQTGMAVARAGGSYDEGYGRVMGGSGTQRSDPMAGMVAGLMRRATADVPAAALPWWAGGDREAQAAAHQQAVDRRTVAQEGLRSLAPFYAGAIDFDEKALGYGVSRENSIRDTQARIEVAKAMMNAKLGAAGGKGNAQPYTVHLAQPMFGESGFVDAPDDPRHPNRTTDIAAFRNQDGTVQYDPASVERRRNELMTAWLMHQNSVGANDWIPFNEAGGVFGPQKLGPDDGAAAVDARLAKEFPGYGTTRSPAPPPGAQVVDGVVFGVEPDGTRIPLQWVDDGWEVVGMPGKAWVP